MDRSENTPSVRSQPVKPQNRPVDAATNQPVSMRPERMVAADAGSYGTGAPEVTENVVEPTASATSTPAIKSSDEAFASLREWALFNLETLAALTQAGNVLALGSHDLLCQARQSGESAFNEGVSGFRAIASAKTVRDGMELQATLIRTSFHHNLAESKRLMLASLELAEKASAPLTARAALAAERVRTHVA